MASPYFSLLVEDRAHEQFVSRALEHWGVPKQRIRCEPYPRGGGSGEQFVRESLAKFVQAIRAATSSKFLIVVADADSGTVSERHAQLNGQLASESLPLVGASDPVVLLIPKRAVETWLVQVLSPPADEATDYHHHFDGTSTAAACKESAIKLEAWLVAGGAIGLSSLDAARPDLLRVRTAAKA